MDQKMKFIGIGLVVFSIACLFLFMQATSQRQILVRESNDLKAENTTLLNKVNQLENDLKANQGRIDSLKVERDKGAQVLRDLQGKLDLVSKSRDELVEKLKKQSQQRQEVIATSTQQQQIVTPENTDAYWGAILQAKTDLEMQLSSTQEGLRSLQISNESLQRGKSILEMDINRLSNEKKDLLRQLDYNQKLLDSMSQEVVRERNDKVAIQETFKTIKVENDALSRQLKNLNSRKEILDKKVQNLQEGKSTVGKRLSEMEAMLTEKISQIDSLKNELDAIKSGKPESIVEKKREAVDLPAIVVRSSVNLEKDKAEISEFSGKILAVNTDNNFVVIDLGASVGVKAGDLFNVYRAGKLIGSIAVIQARENISACDIKRVSTALKIGDNIN
jgi:chromosome segregation ATPase